MGEGVVGLLFEVPVGYPNGHKLEAGEKPGEIFPEVTDLRIIDYRFKNN